MRAGTSRWPRRRKAYTPWRSAKRKASVNTSASSHNDINQPREISSLRLTKKSITTSEIEPVVTALKMPAYSCTPPNRVLNE